MSNKLAHRTMAIIGVGAGGVFGLNTCQASEYPNETLRAPAAIEYDATATTLADLAMDSIISVIIPDTRAVETTTTTTEATRIIELCEDNTSYSVLSSASLGLLAKEVECSGDGKFLKPSVFPGSPTFSEFINPENELSIAIGAHRTKEDRPFNQLANVPIGEIITLGESQFVVTETGIVKETDFNDWYNERILQSETKVLGLYTCSDIIGAPKGVNPSLDGTSHRIFVIAQPMDSIEAQAVLSSTTTTMPPVSS